MLKIIKKIILFAASSIFLGGLFFFCPDYEAKERDFCVFENSFLIVQNNSILPTSSLPDIKITRKIKVITTAYSSSVWQTDDTPFITAAGTRVRDGIVANNLLPFGAKIRLPEIYGDKIFVVEDRMHSRKSPYHIDVWLASYNEALNFGAKQTYMEVLEN